MEFVIISLEPPVRNAGNQALKRGIVNIFFLIIFKQKCTSVGACYCPPKFKCPDCARIDPWNVNGTVCTKQPKKSHVRFKHFH